MYGYMKEVVSASEISYRKKIIGLAVDVANVIMGAHYSVASLLQEDIPGIFIMKCACHSFHLWTSYACKTLPRGVKDLTRDMYNYFLSPKQTAGYKEFQAPCRCETT